MKKISSCYTWKNANYFDTKMNVITIKCQAVNWILGGHFVEGGWKIGGANGNIKGRKERGGKRRERQKTRQEGS